MLLLGDCLDLMRGMDAGCIDLTVTSPPYDNLRTYNGSLNDWTEAKWKAIIAELFLVTKQGGVVVWVVGDATVNGSETGTSFRQALWAMECGFNLHDTMIYEKAGTGAAGSNLSYWQTWEYMFVFSKGRLATFNPITIPGSRTVAGGVRNGLEKKKKTETRTVGSKEQRRNNIWRYAVGAANRDEKTGHPAVFPEALARDHILSWSNEGDTVFDPFLGSGTTGKMALAHRRKFIGIERDPAYFAIAQKRIEQAPQGDRDAVRQITARKDRNGRHEDQGFRPARQERVG